MNDVNDAISREQAIETFKDCAVNGVGIDGIVDALKQLPPIHPVNNSEMPNSSDVISRQAAIDATKKHYRAHDNDLLELIAFDIERLPPAEPKRGKWIKTARWGRVYYCDQCRNYLDFDGVNAGRGSTNYCPNCGCRMDGGE